MVAANKGNPSRKAFAEVLIAFAAFRKRYPNAILYLHTCGSTLYQGVDFQRALQLNRLDPGVDVFMPDQTQLLLGFTPDVMRAIYNAMDVLISPSYGEGFGIPILEAQACGTPVIVGDWTSMTELCFAGWKIPKEQSHPFLTPLGAYQYMPNPRAIETALCQSYRALGDRTTAGRLRDRARQGAEPYCADRVTREYWQPTLERIAGKLAARTERRSLIDIRPEEAA
jgi:glycosyltransferase involved in cell wall biosynthesis